VQNHFYSKETIFKELVTYRSALYFLDALWQSAALAACLALQPSQPLLPPLPALESSSKTKR